VGWIWVVLVFALVPILRFQWSEDRTRAKKLSGRLRESLGPSLADWLVATRDLGARLQDVEHAIKVLGAQEIERKNAGLVRPVAFEVDDTNLYQRIKDVEAQSVAWSERGRALRAELARRDVSIELPAAGVSIPWSIELGGREDRIPELQLALARCREALSLVQRVDKTLSGRE